MLPQHHRLRKPNDFTAVLRGGGLSGARRAGTPRIVIHRGSPATVASPASARVGFVVSGAVGNSVVRHRVTRQLRHLVAERLSTLPRGTDVVIRAQPAAAKSTSVELGRDLDRLLRRVLS